jgi:hypothetical protein
MSQHLVMQKRYCSNKYQPLSFNQDFLHLGNILINVLSRIK